MTASILAAGYSSVAGQTWFLVGEEKCVVYVVTKADAPAREEEKWGAKVYRPGSRFASGPAVAEEKREALAEICRSVDWISIATQINWDDLKSGNEIYWSYKESAQPRLQPTRPFGPFF
jgi:hypothetical protein